MTGQEDGPELKEWKWKDKLLSIDPDQTQLPKGFLKSKPSSWFPHLASEWLPLAHSLAVDLRVIDATTASKLPDDLDLGYGLSVNQEPCAIFFDNELIRLALEIVVPGSIAEARDIVLEYFGRRFVSSVKSTWIGRTDQTILFDKRIDPFTIDIKGAISLTISINGVTCKVWIGLGAQLVQEIDTTWRRQISGTTKNSEGLQDVYFEIAQLAVPPSELITYTQSGTKIDLEVPVSDTVTIRTIEKPIFVGKLKQSKGNLVVETSSLTPTQAILPEGMTRLSIILTKLSVESSVIQDNQFIGAIWETGAMLSGTVSMMLNNEIVGQGVLYEYEGRFALSVD